MTDKLQTSRKKEDFAFPDKRDSEKFKTRVQRFYEFLNQKFNTSIYGEYAIFMNWGYEPDEHPTYSQVELPEYFLNKRSTQLILELVGNCELKDTDVLDVGCGRGGTLYTLSQFYQAKTLTGIDITDANINFCCQNFDGEPIKFIKGDAENLPFSDNAFDILTNVESSHVYPDLFQFYREVNRVLKPGGYFLYTDIFPNQEIPSYLAYLQDIGLSLELDRDITSNVILSRKLDAENQMGALAISEQETAGSQEQEEDIQAHKHVMALPGSDLYERLKCQEYGYRIYRFKKQDE